MPSPSLRGNEVVVEAYGGPTTLIEYCGLRFLTDPTFDPPGEYPTGAGRLIKIHDGSAEASEIGHVDAVLLSLSHDEHPDNLDRAGRALLPTIPAVFTTVSGADRLGGNARGLAIWQSAAMRTPAGTTVTITAVPARHGPPGCEPLCGDVVGFVLTAESTPTVYVSGDNASLECVWQIAERLGPVDTAVLFLGGVRHPTSFDNRLVTLDGARGAVAAKILNARRVVPAHFEGWAHFKEGRDDIEAAFAQAGLASRLDFGERVRSPR